MLERFVIIRMELYESPYYMEKRSTVKELLKNKVIDESDIEEMAGGKEICKKIPVV